MTDQLSREEAIRLINNGFAEELELQARRCTAPIFWYDPQAPPGSRIINNGTMFFLRLPKALIGVTADHVYQGYLDALDKNAAIRCRLHSLEFDFCSRSRDRSKELDLATFNIIEEDLSELNQVVHTPPRSWPPSSIQEGKGVIFVGYPGIYREEKDMRVYWTAYSAETVAQVVADDRIVVQFEREYQVSRRNKKAAPPNVWLGGMSGSPLFGLWESPIFYLQIAGVGLQFNEALEIARFIPINYLEIDGCIKKANEN
jgi:hypothetical protein